MLPWESFMVHHAMKGEHAWPSGGEKGVLGKTTRNQRAPTEEYYYNITMHYNGASDERIEKTLQKICFTAPF